DHGPSVESAAATTTFLQNTYPQLYAKGKHTVVKPGDRIPITGLEVHVMSAAGQLAKSSLPGAGKPNPYCAAFKPHDPDMTEKAQWVGTHSAVGKFRVLHLGDLTVNRESDLMCPNTRIGAVDLFVVSPHGQPISNSAVLVHAIQPKVALLNNGIRKGGQ